jgi:hypothetical protein
VASSESLRRPHRVAPPSALLHPILRRMRQRSVMISNPRQVENIDIAAACRWLGRRVEATRPPDLSNNRKAPDRLRHSHGRLTLGLNTHRADTSRLQSPRLQPSLGQRTFDDMPLDSFAMLAGKRPKVLARRAWLNCRQIHWRTASCALRTLVLYVEHSQPSLLFQ